MTTTFWNGNGQSTAQSVSGTVNAVPVGGNGTLTATVGTKSLTYVTLSTDTITTAASNLEALLSDTTTAPPEFNQITFSVSGNVVYAEAATPGVPFSLQFTSGQGASITQNTVANNSSPSDVWNPNNWIRGGFLGGSPGLPQNGDDVVLSNSSVPLLYNLNMLAAVQFNSFTRWQSFQGTVGLPEWNPNGYWEYLPTYFQFSGPPSGTLTLLLGQGTSGTGPQRERYNVGNQLTQLDLLQSGSPLDAFAVRFLGTNGGNIIQQVGSSLGVAMLVGEQAALSSAIVDGAGLLGLGAGVIYGSSISGSSIFGSSSGSARKSSSSSGSSGSATPTSTGLVQIINGQAQIYSAPGSLLVDSGSQVLVQGVGLTYPSVTVSSNSTLTWISNSGIGNLLLVNGSVFNKSQDVQKMTIAAATIDANSCQVLDPNNAIVWGSPIVLNNSLQSGPFILGRGRQLQII